MRGINPSLAHQERHCAPSGHKAALCSAPDRVLSPRDSLFPPGTGCSQNGQMASPSYPPVRFAKTWCLPQKHKPAPHPRKTLPGAKWPVRSRTIKPSPPPLVTHGGMLQRGPSFRSVSSRDPSDPHPDKKLSSGLRCQRHCIYIIPNFQEYVKAEFSVSGGYLGNRLL